MTALTAEPDLPVCHLCGNPVGPWVPDPSGARWPSGAQKLVCKDGCKPTTAPLSEQRLAEIAAREAETRAAARTDVPALLAEVERLTRLVAAMHRAARGDDAPVLLGLVDDVALTRDAFLAQQSKAATFERLLTIEKAEKKRMLTLLHDVQKIARGRGAEAKGRRIHGEALAARVAELEAERDQVRGRAFAQAADAMAAQGYEDGESLLRLMAAAQDPESGDPS
ncbi:hypothetical protein [Actinacidiphila sp. ITFR-21]|uniref:hypothetical protein n=1 Tax=Actinacidiphila sp. ITFR-21 TaxID=3075199 RepID=UPI00288C5F7B|nr:hypothetical protein [Streptomyces sp. ITFR-21]WNI19121.1 hypothetical protein RLT57_28695 [Streptomyces sp. ITFR-21]